MNLQHQPLYSHLPWNCLDRQPSWLHRYEANNSQNQKDWKNSNWTMKNQSRQYLPRNDLLLYQTKPKKHQTGWWCVRRLRIYKAYKAKSTSGCVHAWMIRVIRIRFAWVYEWTNTGTFLWFIRFEFLATHHTYCKLSTVIITNWIAGKELHVRVVKTNFRKTLRQEIFCEMVY